MSMLAAWRGRKNGDGEKGELIMNRKGYTSSAIGKDRTTFRESGKRA